jgi:trimethylamine--corrinoid protein Co-methyltransferase
MLILTDMMIGRVKQILRPVELTDDALAVDVINDVARSGGLYLTHPHTQKKFRQALWLPPKYINRKHFTFEKEDDLLDLLSDEVDSILSRHKPSDISQDKIDEIDQYLDSI